MSLSIHDFPAVDSLVRQLRVDPQCLRRCRNAFYKQGMAAADALTALPESARAEFATQLQGDCLALDRRQDSARDGATKLAFRTADGHVIESVILRIRSGRTSLCVSTQVGCVGGCRFCATGDMGFVRDLTRDEILDQVLQANRLLRTAADGTGGTDGTNGTDVSNGSSGRVGSTGSVRNVVFMGMGEPFLNEANLYAALDLLLSPQAFNLSARKITVSTIGIPDAMRRFEERYPDTGLALSLHSAQEPIRRQLVPLTARYPLPELRQGLLHITGRRRNRQAAAPRVFVEYLLLDGVNDGPDALAALMEFLTDIPSHVNLIPLNVTATSAGLRGTPEAARHAFARALRAAGFPVTLRYSLGDDIAAACGQLAGCARAVRE